MHKVWKIEAKDRGDYVKTITARIRNLCRCVQQGVSHDKKKEFQSKREWVRLLPWIKKEEKGRIKERGVSSTELPDNQEGPQEATPPAKEKNETEQDGKEKEGSERAPKSPKKEKKSKGESLLPLAGDYYFFGFDEEHKLPWRKLGDKGKKEFALRMEAPEKRDDAEPAVGIWPRDFTRNVPEMTCGALRTLNKGRPRNSKEAAQPAGMTETDLPSGSGKQKDLATEALIHKRLQKDLNISVVHKITNNAISLKMKKDRQLLMTMYEQNSQILQVGVATFGPEDDEDSQLQAAQFMGELAKLYANDKVEKKDLKERRNSMLEDMGKQVRAKPKAKAKASSSKKEEDEEEAKGEKPIKKGKSKKKVSWKKNEDIDWDGLDKAGKEGKHKAKQDAKQGDVQEPPSKRAKASPKAKAKGSAGQDMYIYISISLSLSLYIYIKSVPVHVQQ